MSLNDDIVAQLKGSSLYQEITKDAEEIYWLFFDLSVALLLELSYIKFDNFRNKCDLFKTTLIKNGFVANDFEYRDIFSIIKKIVEN